MTEQNVRKPLRNFFIKKSLQLTMVMKMILIVLLSTVMTTILLAVIYNAKSQGGSFYYMSNNVMEDLQLQSILGIILPALITAQVVSIIIVILIGLFSSRKIAVPLYKIEQWARHLRAGELNAYLAFRETSEMKDLVGQCNGVTEKFKQTLIEIKSAADAMEQSGADPTVVEQQVARIRGVLGKYEF
jgi:methyl-accepting chemotaxis protein